MHKRDNAITRIYKAKSQMRIKSNSNELAQFYASGIVQLNWLIMVADKAQHFRCKT